MVRHSLRSEIVRNAILASLPPEEFASLLPSLSRVQLVANQVLSEFNEAPEHAYFLETGIASMRDVTVPTSPIQVAVVGREGLVGCEALLLTKQPTFASVLTLKQGTAIRIPIRDLALKLESCPSLRAACMSAVTALIRQIMETAASNARDSLSQRCVRLLLMFHDRIDGEDVQITHEAMSLMLGVRRSGVTLVAADLQCEGLVRVSRGRITILDRPGLERQLPGVARQRAANGRDKSSPPLRPHAYPVDDIHGHEL